MNEAPKLEVSQVGVGGAGIGRLARRTRDWTDSGLGRCLGWSGFSLEVMRFSTDGKEKFTALANLYSIEASRTMDKEYAVAPHRCEALSN